MMDFIKRMYPFVLALLLVTAAFSCDRKESSDQSGEKTDQTMHETGRQPSQSPDQGNQGMGNTNKQMEDSGETGRTNQ